jgi:hypothetical protein
MQRDQWCVARAERVALELWPSLSGGVMPWSTGAQDARREKGACQQEDLGDTTRPSMSRVEASHVVGSLNMGRRWRHVIALLSVDANVVAGIRAEVVSTRRTWSM